MKNRNTKTWAIGACLLINVLSLSAFAQFQSNAQTFNLPKKTICTATINSADEKEVFQKYLHPDHFNFVELVKGKSDTGFLQRACKNPTLKCDVTLISGHFGGGFTDNEGFLVPLEDIEKVSCQSCPQVMGSADVVYLFGCNTLAGKNLDGRTPEEYYRVLVDEVGLEPSEARATVAVRYSAIGDSFYDRLRRIFKGSAAIAGFTSKAPLGEQIRPSLSGYFGTLVSGLKLDGVLEDWERREISLAYYKELERLKAGQKNGLNQAAFQAKKPLQHRIGGIISNGYIDVPGVQSNTTEDFVATRMCSINQSKNRLQVIADIINTGDRAFVIRMLPYLLDISKKGERRNDAQDAFFANLSRNFQLREMIAGPTGIINELKEAPLEQLETVDLAVNLSWLSLHDQAAYYRNAAVHIWNNPATYIENKKFLSKMKPHLQLISLNEIKETAFRGKSMWLMLQNFKSQDMNWINLGLNNLNVSLNYYVNSYKNNTAALLKPNLSEGLIKKHKTKAEAAKKAANEVCSLAAKLSDNKNAVISIAQQFQVELSEMKAKSCF